jgi:hypothetical protein
VAILTQTLLALVRRHFMAFSLFSAWHDTYVLKFLILLNVFFTLVGRSLQKAIGCGTEQFVNN